ncbi:unnamed protein product [Urochloa decumbens]|uniref:Chlorophyll a-b binding protein, chloroplastic n=1 Tax=Urochloa decumbens TaxID=240449 RepID=A0ABC9BMP9_9POAL
MASVTARAPVAALRPSSASLRSSSAFLGHSTRLGRATASPATTRRSLKAEAKGEWLPGLPSPAYLDGSVNQDPIFKSYSLPPHECGYPGSVFNPLNFAPTLEAKEKELANGRLAMLAFLGFLIQHNVTGKGPFDNLLQHLSDPWHNTIIQTFSG